MNVPFTHMRLTTVSGKVSLVFPSKMLSIAGQESVKKFKHYRILQAVSKRIGSGFEFCNANPQLLCSVAVKTTQILPGQVCAIMIVVIA